MSTGVGEVFKMTVQLPKNPVLITELAQGVQQEGGAKMEGSLTYAAKVVYISWGVGTVWPIVRT